MRMKDFLRRATAFLAAMILLAGAAQAESFAAIVTAKEMNLFADEACTWNIGQLPRTTVVSVESYANGVAKISLGEQEGYAAVKDMAALSSLAKPAEINRNTYVFKKASLSSAAMKVKKGMQVNLIATNGKWAMVEKGGIIAYMNKDHLTVTEPEILPEATQKPESKSFSAEVTVSRMRVYKKNSTKSACLGAVKQGTVVTVHAYKGGWAYIELNGRKGYAQVADMQRVQEETEPDTVWPEFNPAPSPTPVPDVKDYISNEDYSVEKRIYLFLTQELGLNTAAACGVLANVEKECSFRVTAASYDGGYGIVQWTGSRNTKLKNWCKENGYDYATLEGQLWFLKYELETTQKRNYERLKSVPDTPAGAYTAGYDFCYHFEIPANRAQRSVTRGNLAKDKYWPRYAG